MNQSFPSARFNKARITALFFPSSTLFKTLVNNVNEKIQIHSLGWSVGFFNPIVDNGLAFNPHDFYQYNINSASILPEFLLTQVQVS
jgi:hypothetical protein